MSNAFFRWRPGMARSIAVLVDRSVLPLLNPGRAQPAQITVPMHWQIPPKPFVGSIVKQDSKRRCKKIHADTRRWRQVERSAGVYERVRVNCTQYAWDGPCFACICLHLRLNLSCAAASQGSQRGPRQYVIAASRAARRSPWPRQVGSETGAMWIGLPLR